VLLEWLGEIGTREFRGLACRTPSIPIMQRTTFGLASVSKRFTAIAVLTAEDCSLLSVDDEILPNRRFPAQTGILRLVLVRHLALEINATSAAN
jgi:CubicO group peptidase (beta-lactamase class C family)